MMMVLLAICIANLLKAHVIIKAMDEFWGLDQEIQEMDEGDHAEPALDGAGDHL